MSKHNRLLAFVLAASFLPALVSCGSGSSAETAPAGTGPVSAPAATEPARTLSLAEQRAQTKDTLPEKDYGDADFNIIYNTPGDKGFRSEGLNGDILNDAIYERNRTVEDRFKIRINYTDQANATVNTTVQNSVAAGDDAWHLLPQHTATAAGWITNGIILNWYEVPYVDFGNPWWLPGNQTDLTYKGVCFLAVGDYPLQTIGRTCCMLFDKDEAADNHLPDMYQLVREGKWTIDRLMEFAETAYRDLNGNGSKDTMVDFFGFTTDVGTNVSVWQQAFGIELVRDGKIVMDNDRMQAACEKVVKLCRENKGTLYDASYKNADGKSQWIGPEVMQKQLTLFATGMLMNGIDYLREMQHDYGILPYPKYNEEQPEYHSTLDLGFQSMAMAKSVRDLERSGIITEALCAESYRKVVPAYYEYVLKQKAARDEETIEMIDFVMSTRLLDFGLIYDNQKGFAFWLQKIVSTGSADYASYYAANSASAINYYKTILEAFENYKKDTK